MLRKRKTPDEPEDPLALTKVGDFFYTRQWTGTIHTVRWLLGPITSPASSRHGIIGYALRDGTVCRLHLCAHDPCTANWNVTHPWKYLPWEPPEHHRFVSFAPHVYDDLDFNPPPMCRVDEKSPRRVPRWRR